MKLDNYPLLKILVPYVLGVLLAYYGRFSIKTCQLFLFLVGILLCLLTLFLLIKRYRWRLLKDSFMEFAFVLMGIASMGYYVNPHFSSKEANLLERNSFWFVRVVDFPQPRARSVKIVAEVLGSAEGDPINAKVLLYLNPTEEASKVQYGDVLLVATQWNPIVSSNNPDAFDYKGYMRKKGIFYSGYVAQGGFMIMEKKMRNPLKLFAHQVQRKLSSVFENAGLSGREYEIINAILLGNDETMEPELKAAYASAGVSHILCVSGMHVGIIFMILNALLKPLDLFKSGRWMKAVLLLLVIWLYANITGLSPSVIRSATMFTFVTLGSLLRRCTNVFHSLFASLFLLLVIRPPLLFEVGFQLSYLAVFGIVLYQPMITEIYHCRTKVGNYFGELIAVSIAAQLSTFPLSIYYFGQFPNYFLLANLSVITLSFVVMVTGIALLAIGFIPAFMKMASWLLIHEIRTMNVIVTFIEHLPGAVTRQIDYSVCQVLLLYVFLTILYCMLRSRRKFLLWTALAVFAVFSGSFVQRKMKILGKTEAVVYNIKNVSALDFSSGTRCVVFSDSIREEGNSYYQYSMAPHARRRHAEMTFVPVDTPQYKTMFVEKNGPLILFEGRRYFLLKGRSGLYPTSHPLKVDVLLLQHNPTQKPDAVRKALLFDEVVADGTVSEYYRKRWRDYCLEEEIPFQEPDVCHIF